MKKYCVHIAEDNKESRFKKGDLVWVREVMFWEDEIIYNLIGNKGEFCMGSEVKKGRVFRKI